MTQYTALTDQEIEVDDTNISDHLTQLRDNPIAIAEGNSPYKYPEEAFGGSPNAGFNRFLSTSVVQFYLDLGTDIGYVLYYPPIFSIFKIHRTGYYKVRIKFSITLGADKRAGIIDANSSEEILTCEATNQGGNAICIANVLLQQGQEIQTWAATSSPPSNFELSVDFGVSDATAAGSKVIFAEQIPNDATQ